LVRPKLPQSRKQNAWFTARHFEGRNVSLEEKICRARRARTAAKQLKEANPGLDVIIPAVPRITAREVIADTLRPVRRNSMKSRRKKLGLSQSELATVLDVDVASIYRHEREHVLPSLWEYALRGIEAEASLPDTRTILRSVRSEMGRPNIIAEGLGAYGHRFVAVRMINIQRENARASRLKRRVQRAEREVGNDVVVDLPKPKAVR
jgi:DNA-binding transcriptional regulator YiaG